MKKAHFVSLRFLLIVLLFLQGFKASAHFDIYGGELTYEHIKDDSLLLTLNIYTSCHVLGPLGADMINALYINVIPKNSAAFSLQPKLISYINAAPINGAGCDPCSNLGCSGDFVFNKAVFQVKVDLKNYTDCEFTFATNEFLVNRQITDSFLISAKLNRCVNGYQNSPNFKFNQQPYSFVNKCVTSNHVVSAGKNDSIVYKLVAPKKSLFTLHKYQTPFTYAKPLKYEGYPDSYPYSFTSCKGFNFNVETAELKFTPKELDTTRIAILVEQYQKDAFGKMTKVGEITREMSLFVWQGYKNNLPIIITGRNQDIYACAGEEITILFNTNDLDIKDTVQVSAYFDIPNATFTHTYWHRLNRGTFKWKPALTDTASGPYKIYITATDDNFYIKGITNAVYNLHIVKPPKIDLNITRNSCGNYTLAAEEDTAQITGYKWFVNDVIFSTSKKPTLQIKENGKYIIKLEATTKGCTILAQDSIEVNYIKTFKIAGDTSICEGATAVLNPYYSGDYHYIWRGRYLTDSTAANPNVSPDSTTIYTVTATDKIYGCQYIDTVVVKVANLQLNAGNDTLVCEMQPLTFNASGSSDAKYYWFLDEKIIDSSATINIISPHKTATYKVVAKNALGCEKTDSIKVNIIPSVAHAGDDKQICLGDSATLTGSGGYHYYWTDTSGNILSMEARYFAKPTQTSTYILYTTDSLRCRTKTDTVEVKVNILQAEIMADTTICEGDVIKLWASGGNAYNWLPENTLSGNNLSNPEVFPTQKTTYYVQVSDTITGCALAKSVTVFVDKDCVWPGDANKDRYVNFKDVLYLGVGYDSSQTSRIVQGNNWKPHVSEPWPQALRNGVNYKHFDANGNGKVDFRDLTTIEENYFNKHDYTAKPYIEPFSGIKLYVHFDKDTFYAGDKVTVKFILGDAGNFPDNIYGAGLEYTITGDLIKDGSKRPIFKNFFTDTLSRNLAQHVYSKNKGEFAIVRTDHNNFSGYGEISSLEFVLEDTTYNYAEKGEKLAVKPVDILAIDNLGNPIDVILGSDSAIVYKKRKVQIPEPEIIPDFKIYPVPTKSSITLESTIDLNTDIYFTNALGQVLGKETVDNEKVKTIDLITLRAGIYFMHFNFDNKHVTRKIIICK